MEDDDASEFLEDKLLDDNDENIDDLLEKKDFNKETETELILDNLLEESEEE